jgi:hypothetical protein
MKPFVTKLSVVRDCFYKGDLKGALSVAAKFSQLGKHEQAIKSGHKAFVNPGFFHQLGRDPKTIISEAKQALIAHFGFR